MSTLHNSFPGGWIKENKNYKFFLIGDIFDSQNLNLGFAINKQLEEATLALGKFSSLIERIPNPTEFIRAYSYNEATLSSRIEGTQATLQDAFIEEDNIPSEKRDDWNELKSYIQSLIFALEELNKLPLCNRLIKNTHKILLSQVRGKDKLPGEFRRSQNWIGGSRPNNAHFVPPAHQYVEKAMGNLESFIQDETLPIPHLIKVALIHYQFETIHPFLDGNGRIGRMLISLYLLENKILNHPILYISSFFENKRKEYYQSLDLARTSQEGLVKWISFFLDAVYQTSKKGIQTTNQLIDLREKLTTKVIPKLGRKTENGLKTLNHLFSNPVINSSTLQKVLNTTAQSTNSILKDFVKLAILVEITGNKRNRVFVFKGYLDLLHN